MTLRRPIHQGPLIGLSSARLRELAADFEKAADDELLRIRQAQLDAMKAERAAADASGATR